MDVRQPALPTARAPLDRQHHEIEGLARLDLDPAGPSPSGRIGRVERLDHHTFLALAQRAREELGGGSRIRGEQTAHRVRRRHLVEDRETLAQRGVDQVTPVGVQHVEEERGELELGRQLRLRRRLPGR